MSYILHACGRFFRQPPDAVLLSPPALGREESLCWKVAKEAVKLIHYQLRKSPVRLAATELQRKNGAGW